MYRSQDRRGTAAEPAAQIRANRVRCGTPLLSTVRAAAVDWLDAEAALEARGLAWLGEVWIFERPDAAALRVRLVEVTPERVVVQTDDFGAIDAPVERFTLPWPAPATLRPRRPGDPDGREMWARRVESSGDR